MKKKENRNALPPIIISGMAGVGKSTLAKALAEIYGIEYVCGGDVLKEMARREGYKVEEENWWETPEGMEFLRKRKEDPNFDKKLDQLLIEIARKGNCVITSWALPWIWGKGVKIWLQASQRVRAERISKRDNISFEEAFEYVKKRDKENVELYKNMYGYTLGRDLHVFDVVLNVEHASQQDVVDMVKCFLEKSKLLEKAEF